MTPPSRSAGQRVRDVRLRVLIDDEPGAPGLLVEHGFALWVETELGRVLFDTGHTGAFVANAQRLGVELTGADVVVLSHGHYDHTGGLTQLLDVLPQVRIVAHPSFDGAHRARSTGEDRDVGVPPEARRALQRACLERHAIPVEVSPAVWTTGEIPRTTDEDVGGAFFSDEAGHVPDPLLDDQALIVRHRAGLVVILGCAHAGVVNTLRQVRQLFPLERVAGVVGGMHLRHASPSRVEATLSELRAEQAALIAPAHCTGQSAQAALVEAVGSRYRRLVVGSGLRLDDTGQWHSW